MTRSSPRNFDCNGETWTAHRDSGARAGSSQAGYLPRAALPGIRFLSSEGERRFLHMGQNELPSSDQFWAMAEDEFCRLLRQARPEQ